MVARFDQDDGMTIAPLVRDTVDDTSVKVRSYQNSGKDAVPNGSQTSEVHCERKFSSIQRTITLPD